MTHSGKSIEEIDVTEKVITRAATSWSCLVCRKSGRKGAHVVSAGGFYRHPGCEPAPVSAPAPTVDTMDDECEHPNGFTEHGCPCGASRPDQDDDLQDFRDPVSPTRADRDTMKYGGGNKGPWFGAMYASTCDGCFDRIQEGDRIRADGQGGYECTPCGDNGEDAIVVVDDWQEQASAAAKRHQALLTLASDGPSGDMASDAFAQEQEQAEEFLAVAAAHVKFGAGECIPLPTPDEFMDPAEPEPELNVSGQPPARRNSKGQYLVVDPATGDFPRYKNGNPIGYTRATTFVKSLVDSKAINDWRCRNVVMGASLRPDVLRQAHGLKHETDKAALDRIVETLTTAAGAKVSADEGTFLHEFTERMDAGLKTWQDAPEAYQADLKRYTEALAKYGLEPVPGLIERTVMVREFGGIVGTFDRVFFHRPSHSYVVGDLKTGKTLSYGIDEIYAQIWVYAHGVNQNGVYDWHTDTWRPLAHDAGVPNSLPPLTRVREDIGVIVHMPVQGPEAGEVYIRKADLVKGRENAELCHTFRSREKSKVEDFTVPTPPDPTWEDRFRAVTSGEEATALWREAKADGIQGIRLEALIDLARQAIRLRSWSDKG